MLGGRISLELDVAITRRKYFHRALAPDGEPLFWCQQMSDLLRWAAEQGQRTYRVSSDRGSFILTINPL